MGLDLTLIVNVGTVEVVLEVGLHGFRPLFGVERVVVLYDVHSIAVVTKQMNLARTTLVRGRALVLVLNPRCQLALVDLCSPIQDVAGDARGASEVLDGVSQPA